MAAVATIAILNMSIPHIIWRGIARWNVQCRIEERVPRPYLYGGSFAIGDHRKGDLARSNQLALRHF
jgi:hypothetical protein